MGLEEILSNFVNENGQAAVADGNGSGGFAMEVSDAAGDGAAHEGDGVDGDEEMVFHQPNPANPLVARLVQRIEKVMPMMREALEQLGTAVVSASTPVSVLPQNEEENIIHRPPAEGTMEGSFEDVLQAEKRLVTVRDLLFFLWTRLLRVLTDENDRCGDSYAQTLDLLQRIPAFEDLARVVYSHNNFCEILSELIDSSYEGRPLPEDIASPPAAASSNGSSEDPPPLTPAQVRHRSVLEEHYAVMVRLQRVATFCGVMIIEGSRESFLEPQGMHDLCKRVMSETSRQKRIIPLSLMFCLLDQDESSIGEVMVQGVPRQLLQWLRHLTHRLFGQPEGEEEESAVRKRAEAQFQGKAISRHMLLSPYDSPIPSPLRSPGMTSRAPTVSFPVTPDVQTLLPPLAAATATTPGATQSVSFSSRSWEAASSSTLNSTFMSRWQQKYATQQTVDLSAWMPAVGDLVGRGPGWRFGTQGKFSDYGEVVGVIGREVLVSWVPSIDAPISVLSAPKAVYRYDFSAPAYEVVSWAAYLRIKTLHVDRDYLYHMEFIWVCAVAGFVCQQHECIQYVLQFQTSGSMVHVLNTTDLEMSHHRAEMATEEAEMHAQQTVTQLQLQHGEELLKCKSEEAWLQDFLMWNSDYRMSKQTFRMNRECVTRAGWLLNALLSHKKLALLFLEQGGIHAVLRIATGPLEVSTMYGCAIILSRLARSAIFEEFLRLNSECFEPTMTFIMRLWKESQHTDVQVSAGAFLFHSLSFPCVLRYFDHAGGPQRTLELLDRALTSSEEQHDVMLSNVQLTAVRCLNIYLVANLILSTNVIFRHHRSISALLKNLSPQVSLPRDPVLVDTMLGHLSASTPSLPEVTLDNVQSLLTLDCLPSIKALLDLGVHRLVFRCIKFYYVQSRWELLIAALQTMHVLTVIPQVRPMLMESRAQEDSCLRHLLMIVHDLSASLHSGASKNHPSREAHIIPCLVTALHALIHLMTPPAPGSSLEDGVAGMAFFNSTCAQFRASDGVRTLLSVAQSKKELSISSKLKYFPVVARAVQLMAVLRRYGDTAKLFEALGVHDFAQRLSAQYVAVQRRLTSSSDSSLSEHDPANRFMEHLTILKKRAFENADESLDSAVKVSASSAVEMDMRQSIIARAIIDYDRESLLDLIAGHLDSEGLKNSAAALRAESHLPQAQSRTPTADNSGGGGSRTSPPCSLDDIIRVYLRQQQEYCTNPIETLPKFDLRRNHVYQPLPQPTDASRGVLNRMLSRKMGRPYTQRMDAYDTFLTYSSPCFMFDVTGVGEGLLGESICFVDNGDALAIGTSEGGLTLFETAVNGSDDKVIEQHMVFDSEGIIALTPSPDGQFLAAIREDHHAVMMHRSSLPAPAIEFNDCAAIRISYDNHFALCTQLNKSCQVYDLESKEVVCTLQENAAAQWANDRNVAIFDPSSRLILHDAVLWDWRCSTSPVFRFDRFSESFASMFHPNGKQVIIDERIWDLRTQGILHTVPSFHGTTSFHTSHLGKVIYSFKERTNEMGDALVSAVDSLSYEVVFSTEVRPPFKTFAVDPSDRFCAAILDQEAEVVIRVFSTSSGPPVDRIPFAAPTLPDERDEDSGVEESDGEEEWSIGSSADDDSSHLTYTGDDDDDDEEDDDDAEEDIEEDATGGFHDEDNSMEEEGEDGDEQSDDEHNEEGFDEESFSDDGDFEEVEDGEEAEEEDSEAAFEQYVPSEDEEEHNNRQRPNSSDPPTTVSPVARSRKRRRKSEVLSDPDT